MEAAKNHVTNPSLQSKNEVDEKKYNCIVIWTFHEDEKQKKYKQLMNVLDEFQFIEIDQSTRGTHQVDLGKFVNKLKSANIHLQDNDFIKVAYTDLPDGIIIQNIEDPIIPLNEQHHHALQLIAKLQ